MLNLPDCLDLEIKYFLFPYMMFFLMKNVNVFQAFFWAIDKYKTANINSGVSVGAAAFDTCFRTDQVS